jgi:seryl-tRNA synthetase
MIDLRAARQDPDAFRAALARKGAAEAFDELLVADRAVLDVQPRVESLRAKRKLKGKPTPEQLQELEQVKVELQQLETELAAAEATRSELLARIPNPPAEDTPDGFTDEDAVEVARVGELALLELSLYRYALDRLMQKGFTVVLPPVLVREEAMYGTGFLPTDEVNIYKVERDELYLTGTAEVGLAAMHMGEILEDDTLPLRYVGYSTNFRREAGAAGKDTRGMFRVHQFDKVEMFVFTTLDVARDEHERLLAIEEELIGDLDIPYRVVNIAAGDLGASAVKKYDIEGWFPGQERYRELTSTSNTTDYQARRLDIRTRRDGKLEHVATLNGTAVTARTVIALMENFQDDGGAIAVPEALWEYGAPHRLGASERV